MSDTDFLVVSTTDDSFDTDVIVRSQLGLVIVDFWADWCAPCRMLAPLLEKLAEEFQDRLTLVKADTEKNPVASQRFGVSGIPAVFAMLDGVVIDAFQGALPEPALREWIEKCLVVEQLFRVQQQIVTDPQAAEATLREIMDRGELTDRTDQTKVLLLQALHEQGKHEACEQLLEELAGRGFLEPECERIQSELALQDKSTADVDALREAIEQDPQDLTKKLELAEALAARKDYPAAFEICLELITKDRATTGEKARLLMLDVFRVEGDESEVTREYRRKLSMALY